MEVLLVVAVFAGVFIALLLRRTENSGTPSQPSRRSQPAPIPKPTLVAKTDQSPRFDATSASHLRDKRILTGSAYITDGDTIKINKTQIRLFGVDAPELNHPYGKKAKWALHKLCKGHIVRAEITDEDDHGRTVAHCYLPDGRDLSAEMVKQGLAIDWPKFSGGIYKELETPDARKKLFLADARQKGRMRVWEKFEAKQNNKQ